MGERALIVEEGGPVAAALRSHLEAAGFAVDVAREEQAPASLRRDHALAVVRAGRAELVAELRARDATLPVVALFRDDDALAADPSAAAAADGVLVGPLAGAAVASTARAMARLAAQARRVAELERAASPRREGFELHRRLLLMEVKRARRYRYPLSLALVSVDGWRDVAPALGPGGRARVLGEVLAIVARSLRAVDLPVLHVGERFLVVMPHTPPDGAFLVANRLLERVATRKGAPRVTVSAGVACFDGQGAVSLGSLLAEAGRGVEEARAAGGGRVVRCPGGRPERKVDLGW